MRIASIKNAIRTSAMLTWPAVLAVAVTSCASGTSGWTPQAQNGSGNASSTVDYQGRFVLPNNVRRVCGQPRNPDQAECLSLVRTDLSPAEALVAGYHPADIQSAYNLPSSTNGSGQTIAIVDAFDDPKAEANLSVYRRTFKLPPCTTANGCFRKVNQKGQPGPYPRPDASWAAEESLDIDMVSAVCPNCHILLVESTKGDLVGLGLSVDEAVKLGANVISNSYTSVGGSADYSVPGYDHPGVIITASSGDGGLYSCPLACAGFPASSPHVVSVGGTTLERVNSNPRGWRENAWAGSGSGCSGLVKPNWQHDEGCTFRTIADVAAVADSDTGVAIYDTFDAPGWQVVGGTSVSSPLVAAVYGLAGNASTLQAARSLYLNAKDLNDIVAGPPTGKCQGQTMYLCYAVPGYDGPTGNGTPNGIGAF